MNFIHVRLAANHALSTAIDKFSASLRLILFSLWISLVLVFVFEVLQLRQSTDIATGIVSCRFWDYSLGWALIASQHLNSLVCQTSWSYRCEFLSPTAWYELVVVAGHIVLVFSSNVLAWEHSAWSEISLILKLLESKLHLDFHLLVVSILPLQLIYFSLSKF